MPNKKNNETTTKFKVDISELKSGITEANRQIRLANAEFKSVASSMSDWADNADGVSAKLTQLDTVLANENKKLDALKRQLQLTAKEYGENSAEADELRIKIANQQAAVNRTTNDIKKYQDILAKLGDESEDAAKDIEDVGDSAEKASGSFTVMKGAISSLIADGLKSLASSVKDTMKEIVIETGAAYDSFQAKTGVATESMAEFEDAINDLYKNNYGESLDDIADSMAEIKQQTGEVDPTKLKDLTENAIALRDTFDFDVKESMRAVNMLMEQFGISGEEAYNLIVQGAQQGLDKNGDLLDTINEYSVHYKQLGYTSEEFFNSLKNGAESGTFSVDKLGDAMKEFGIRTKDTAASTDEGFQLIGLNADEMREAFNEGGEAAKRASEKTLEALLNMDNQVKRNQAGVDLFGTMWEDLGIDGVKALVNTQGEIKKTTKSMEELKKIKYDNVKSKFEQIGRTIKMDLLMPFAEKLIPKAEKFTDYCINNSDKIVKHLKAIGVTITTVFVVNKIAKFTQSVVTMISTYKNLKTAIDNSATAQKIFNGIQLSSPAGALVTTIGLLTGAYFALRDEGDKVREHYAKLTDEEQKNVDKINELSQAYKDSKDTVDKSVSDTSAQFAYYQNLVDELDGIVDANGRVKEGYEERANFILTTLNNALGTELSMTGNIIDNYDKQKQSLLDLIKTKKAQIILQANEQLYTDAITKQTEAFNALSAAQTDLKNVTDEVKTAQEEYDNIKNMSIDQYAKEHSLIGLTAHEINDSYNSALERAQSKLEGLTDKQTTLNSKVEEAEDDWIKYNSTIKNYEGLSSAIISGDVDKINDSLNLMVNNFITAEEGNRRTLEKQVENMRTNYENLKKAIEAGAPGVTQEMVDTASDMVNASITELGRFEDKSKESSLKAVQGIIDVIKSKTSEIRQATENSGDNFIQGFINKLGDNSVLKKLGNAVTGVGKRIMGWFNTSLGEHSPSKYTEKSADYFLRGFGNGVDKNISALGYKVKAVGSSLVDNFNTGLETPDDIGIIRSGLMNDYNTGGTVSKTTQVTNNYNFSQTNNSPKALSRLEIYRHTKNQFNYAVGGSV
nr:MAG TPA: minor tail protein [Caudoviricetes sp.]